MTDEPREVKPVAFARQDAIAAMERGGTFWDTTLTCKPDERERTSVPLYPADAILKLQGEVAEARDAFKALITAMAHEGMDIGENADGSIRIKNNTAEAAEAEVARMREQQAPLLKAVDDILGTLGPDGYLGATGKPRTDALRRARSALQGEPTT